MYFVFEGPDGGGKSSAIEKVRSAYPQIKMMARASHSVHGPVPQLDDWVDESVSFLHGADWSGDGAFDRHPLISELIYGPVVRGRMPGRFNDEPWLRMRVRELANRVVVVWCIPPFDAAEHAMTGSSQMDGVVDRYRGIHSAYVAMRAVWPGLRQYTHDYTRDPDGRGLFEVIRQHLGRNQNVE
jgi:hypothetical protein